MNVQDLNVIIGTVTGFIRNYVNLKIEGMKLLGPEFDDIRIDLNKTAVAEKHHYVQFTTSPDFVVNSVKSVYKGAVWDTAPCTEEEKIQRLAELFKFTPIYSAL